MARAKRMVFPNESSGDNFPIVEVPFKVLPDTATLATPKVNTIYLLTKATASTITITNPVAGSGPGGEDGIEVSFVDGYGSAHVIQGDATMTATDTSGFGGADLDKATLGGTIGDQFTMIAYNGLWYSEMGKSIHATLADT